MGGNRGVGRGVGGDRGVDGVDGDRGWVEWVGRGGGWG